MTTLLLAELVDEGKLRWDQPVAEVYPAFRLGDAGDHEAGPGQAPGLRLHRPAAPGPRVALRVPQRHAGLDADAARHDAADQPLRRGVPVQQPHGGGGRLRRRRAVAYPGQELGAAYDEAMRTKIFEPLGMTHTTFDFAQALAGNARAAALRRRRPASCAGAHGHERVGRYRSGRPAASGPAPTTSLSYVQMELALGAAARRQAADLRGKRCSPAAAAGRHRARTSPTAWASWSTRRWGVPVVHHGGDLSGYHSDMIWSCPSTASAR